MVQFFCYFCCQGQNASLRQRCYFYCEGLSCSIGDLINRNFYLADKNIVINSGLEKIKCRAHSIDESGCLLATTSKGKQMSFNAGEAWLDKGNWLKNACSN